MKKLNPYSHLLIKMSLVLLIVVTATFLNRIDANARAESGDSAAGSEIGSRSDGENRSGTADNTDDGYGGPDVSGTATAYTGQNGAGKSTYENVGKQGDPGIDTAMGDGTNDGDSGNNGIIGSDTGGGAQNAYEGSDGNTGGNAGETRTDVIIGDGDDDFETLDPNEDQNAEESLTEEELQAIAEAEAAAKLAEYKKSQEYIDTLLVTHPDHYDAEVVERAKAIPLDSDNDRYLYITGKDKKVYKVGGMPEGYRNDVEAATQMVTLDVPVWKMKNNGEKYSSYWPITINAKLADSIRCIFSDIYLLDIKFPFNYLIGYSYRKVGGVGLVNSKLMSTHAFGVALDINLGDYDNDYFLGKGNDLRNKKNPYCIPDEVIEIFESYGWFWGGNYEICADTMHFQYFELGFLQYDSDEPFPILSRTAENMDPKVIRNLSQRLVELGYLEKETQNFSKKVDKAVKQFQEEHGLEPTGIVDYATWEPLINLTHYMTYVF